jgi:hypothetical protein
MWMKQLRLMPCLVGAAFLVTFSCADASPCDRVLLRLTATQKSNLSATVATQLETASAKILRSYRLGNWYLFYLETQAADRDFVFFRGEPSSHQYVALWSSGAGNTQQPELRTWARLHAPGIPETLASCFASIAVDGRRP